MSANPPLFIVGPPRTGTTLLARILARHPRIFVAGETHFFEDIYSRRRRLGNAAHPDAKDRIMARLATLYARFDEPATQHRIEALFAQPSVRARLRAADTYAALFGELMAVQAEAAGKRRWANHCPRDLFHLEEIRAFFPDAKIIACVRDVRAFLCSYKHQWKAATGRSAARIRQLYHPILTSLLWRASIDRVRSAQRSLEPERLLIVPYERLVADPHGGVRQVCEFLEEPFCEDLLAITGANSSFAVPGGGVFASSIERWRTEMSPEEVFVAQTVAGARLAQFGYARESARPQLPVLAAMLCTLPLATLRALRANREIRGPLIPYALKRLAALRL